MCHLSRGQSCVVRNIPLVEIGSSVYIRGKILLLHRWTAVFRMGPSETYCIGIHILLRLFSFNHSYMH